MEIGSLRYRASSSFQKLTYVGMLKDMAVSNHVRDKLTMENSIYGDCLKVDG